MAPGLATRLLHWSLPLAAMGLGFALWFASPDPSENQLFALAIFYLMAIGIVAVGPKLSDPSPRAAAHPAARLSPPIAEAPAPAADLPARLREIIAKEQRETDERELQKEAAFHEAVQQAGETVDEPEPVMMLGADDRRSDYRTAGQRMAARKADRRNGIHGAGISSIE